MAEKAVQIWRFVRKRNIEQHIQFQIVMQHVMDIALPAGVPKKKTIIEFIKVVRQS